MGKACPRREDLCGFIGQIISTETCAFVTVPGLSPVPAVPAQAVCARVTKNTQLADHENIVCNGKYGQNENART